MGLSYYRRGIFPEYQTKGWKADVELRRRKTAFGRIRTISRKSLTKGGIIRWKENNKYFKRKEQKI